jgi:CubicO group peptidase (beta-lactamase class C family)
MNPHSPAEVLALVRDKPLDFEPGARFEYSSSNYELLGAIIEKVGGKPYGEQLQERIFGPLGMRRSGLDADGLVLARRAQGYRVQPDGVLAHDPSGSMTVPWAAGSIYSTTGDLLRWERALFGGKLLSADELKAMTTPGLGAYGLGVVVSSAGGRTLIWHNGGIGGFNSYLAYAPDCRLTVVVLGNLFNIPTSDKLGRELLDVALGKSGGPPRLSPTELDRFVGAYDLAGSSVAFRRDGDRLDSISNGAVFPTLYEGVMDGHPTFYVPAVGAEIAFVADANGTFSSLVMHQYGRETPGHRR